MQMQPIVDRLQGEFGGQIAFAYLNAVDGGEGQAAFESLSLPGHPSYVIFNRDGTEVYRSFGGVNQAVLGGAVDAVLGN